MLDAVSRRARARCHASLPCACSPTSSPDRSASEALQSSAPSASLTGRSRASSAWSALPTNASGAADACTAARAACTRAADSASAGAPCCGAPLCTAPGRGGCRGSSAPGPSSAEANARPEVARSRSGTLLPGPVGGDTGLAPAAARASPWSGASEGSRGGRPRCAASARPGCCRGDRSPVCGSAVRIGGGFGNSARTAPWSGAATPGRGGGRGGLPGGEPCARGFRGDRIAVMPSGFARRSAALRMYAATCVVGTESAHAQRAARGLSTGRCAAWKTGPRGARAPHCRHGGY